MRTQTRIVAALAILSFAFVSTGCHYTGMNWSKDWYKPTSYALGFKKSADDEVPAYYSVDGLAGTKMPPHMESSPNVQEPMGGYTSERQTASTQPASQYDALMQDSTQVARMSSNTMPMNAAPANAVQPAPYGGQYGNQYSGQYGTLPMDYQRTNGHTPAIPSNPQPMYSQPAARANPGMNTSAMNTGTSMYPPADPMIQQNPYAPANHTPASGTANNMVASAATASATPGAYGTPTTTPTAAVAPAGAVSATPVNQPFGSVAVGGYNVTTY